MNLVGLRSYVACIVVSILSCEGHEKQASSEELKDLLLMLNPSVTSARTETRIEPRHSAPQMQMWQEPFILPDKPSIADMNRAFWEAAKESLDHPEIWPEVTGLFNKLDEFELDHNHLHYNAGMKVYANAGRPVEALSLLQQMRSHKLKDDGIVYNLIVDAIAKDVARTNPQFNGNNIEWLDRIEASELKASIVGHGVVMNNFARANDDEGATAMLERIKKKGLKRNIVAYSCVVERFCEHHEIKTAEKWLQLCKDDKFKPDVVTYTALVHANNRTDNADAAAGWLDTMLSTKVAPAVDSFHAVMDAYRRKDDEANVVMWHDKMIEEELKPNVVQYNQLIKEFSEEPINDNADSMTRWRYKMQKASVKVDQAKIGTILQAIIGRKQYEKGYQLLEQVDRIGITSSCYIVYNLLRLAHIKDGDKERADYLDNKMIALVLNKQLLSFPGIYATEADDYEERER